MTNVYYKEFLHTSDVDQELVCFYCKQHLNTHQTRVYRVLVKHASLITAAQNSLNNTPDSIFRKLQPYAIDANDTPVSNLSQMTTPLLSNRAIQAQNDKANKEADDVVIQPFHKALCFGLYLKAQQLQNVQYYCYAPRWQQMYSGNTEMFVNDLHSKHGYIIDLCEKTCLPNKHHWMPAVCKTYGDCLSFKFEGVLSQTHAIPCELFPFSFVDHMFTKVQIIKLQLPRHPVYLNKFKAHCIKILSRFSNSNQVIAELYWAVHQTHPSYFKPEEQQIAKVQIVIVARLKQALLQQLFVQLRHGKHLIFERINYTNESQRTTKQEQQSPWFQMHTRFRFALLDAIVCLYKAITEIDTKAWLPSAYFIWNHVFNMHRTFTSVSHVGSPKSNKFSPMFNKMNYDNIPHASSAPTMEQMYTITSTRPSLIKDAFPSDAIWAAMKGQVHVLECSNLDPVHSRQQLVKKRPYNHMMFQSFVNSQTSNVLRKYFIINTQSKQLIAFEGEYENELFPIIINDKMASDFSIEASLLHCQFNSSYESVEHLGESESNRRQQDVVDAILLDVGVDRERTRIQTHSGVSADQITAVVPHISPAALHRSISSYMSNADILDLQHQSAPVIRKASESISLSTTVSAVVETFTDANEYDSPTTFQFP